MSWKCKKCGHKLSGKEKYCPECAGKAVYECKKCAKVMDNGKHRYCPVCKMEREEKRIKAVKGACGTVVAVGSVAIGIVSRGKLGGGKS